VVQLNLTVALAIRAVVVGAVMAPTSMAAVLLLVTASSVAVAVAVAATTAVVVVVPVPPGATETVGEAVPASPRPTQATCRW
jgi:hypothetical protein